MSSTAQSGEISGVLYCAVQEFTSISVETNTSEGFSTKKIPASKQIKVIYQPLGNSTVKEIYGAKLDIERISILTKGYTAGGTQYLNPNDDKTVVTYFGKNDSGYHVVVRYSRMQRNNGGKNNGWRTDSYFNAFMYCADQTKIDKANK